MAIKITHMGQRILSYGSTLVELWFEGTQFSHNETNYF